MAQNASENLDIKNFTDNDKGPIVYNQYQATSPVSAPVEQHSCKLCSKSIRRVKHATTGLIYFCYITAYTLQNSLVINYVQENLLTEYSVKSCEANSSAETTTNESGEENENSSPEEQCEKEFEKWNVYLTIIFTVPAFVLAPFVGSWCDSLHRLIPMYISIGAMIISSIAVPLAIIFHASNEITTFCIYPICLTGGTIVFFVIIFGFEADVKNGFEIFERFMTLTAVNVTALAICQILLTVLDAQVGTVVNDYIIWVPIVVMSLGLLQMFLRSERISDSRDSIDSDQPLCMKILPWNFFRLFQCNQGIFIVALFFCSFFYYFLYVGETLEIIEFLEDSEPWQIATFTKQGAVQGVAGALSLFFCVFICQRLVEKRIVDKKLIPKLSMSYVALVALALDFLTKLIVSFVSTDSAQSWVPVIGIICEVDIVVIRYLAVLLVPKTDAAKSLSMLALGQLAAVFPAPLFVQSVQKWTESFWSDFTYLFLGLLLLIPSLLILLVGKFASLPLPEMKHHKEEGGEEETGRKRKRRFRRNNKSGYDPNI